MTVYMVMHGRKGDFDPYLTDARGLPVVNETVPAGIADDLLAACLDMLPLLEHAEKCEAMADDGLGTRLRTLRLRLDTIRAIIHKATKE